MTIKQHLLIDQVIEYAKAQNRNALDEINKSVPGASDLVCAAPYAYQAVYFLAKEGEKEAVFLLLDEYKASVSQAVIGAAQGNKQDLLKEILFIYCFSLLPLDTYAVFGFAWANNREKIAEFKSNAKYIPHIVCGLATGLHHAELLKYKVKQDKKLCLEALSGYSRSGYHEGIREYVTIAKNLGHDEANIYCQVFIDLSTYGHLDLLETIFIEKSITDKNEKLRHELINLTAALPEKKLTERLLIQNGSFKLAMQVYNRHHKLDLIEEFNQLCYMLTPNLMANPVNIDSCCAEVPATKLSKRFTVGDLIKELNSLISTSTNKNTTKLLKLLRLICEEANKRHISLQRLLEEPLGNLTNNTVHADSSFFDVLITEQYINVFVILLRKHENFRHEISKKTLNHYKAFFSNKEDNNIFAYRFYMPLCVLMSQPNWQEIANLLKLPTKIVEEVFFGGIDYVSLAWSSFVSPAYLILRQAKGLEYFLANPPLDKMLLKYLNNPTLFYFVLNKKIGRDWLIKNPVFLERITRETLSFSYISDKIMEHGELRDLIVNYPHNPRSNRPHPLSLFPPVHQAALRLERKKIISQIVAIKVGKNRLKESIVKCGYGSKSDFKVTVVDNNFKVVFNKNQLQLFETISRLFNKSDESIVFSLNQDQSKFEILFPLKSVDKIVDFIEKNNTHLTLTPQQPLTNEPLENNPNLNNKNNSDATELTIDIEAWIKGISAIFCNASHLQFLRLQQDIPKVTASDAIIIAPVLRAGEPLVIYIRLPEQDIITTVYDGKQEDLAAEVTLTADFIQEKILIPFINFITSAQKADVKHSSREIIIEPKTSQLNRFKSRQNRTFKNLQATLLPKEPLNNQQIIEEPISAYDDKIVVNDTEEISDGEEDKREEIVPKQPVPVENTPFISIANHQGRVYKTIEFSNEIENIVLIIKQALLLTPELKVKMAITGDYARALVQNEKQIKSDLDLTSTVIPDWLLRKIGLSKRRTFVYSDGTEAVLYCGKILGVPVDLLMIGDCDNWMEKNIRNRDFKRGSLLIDVLDRNCYDLVNAIKDIAFNELRSNLSPEQCFKEDTSRLLRAVKDELQGVNLSLKLEKAMIHWSPEGANNDDAHNAFVAFKYMKRFGVNRYINALRKFNLVNKLFQLEITSSNNDIANHIENTVIKATINKWIQDEKIQPERYINMIYNDLKLFNPELYVVHLKEFGLLKKLFNQNDWNNLAYLAPFLREKVERLMLYNMMQKWLKAEKIDIPHFAKQIQVGLKRYTPTTYLTVLAETGLLKAVFNLTYEANNADEIINRFESQLSQLIGEAQANSVNFKENKATFFKPETLNFQILPTYSDIVQRKSS